MIQPEHSLIFEESPSDLLDRAATLEDTAQPDLREIARIVHDIRGVC